MRPPNWLRIGKPHREGNEVVYPLSIDEGEAIREGQRLLRESGWTASDVVEAWESVRSALQAAGQLGGSDDPGLSPDAARWTPEDET